MTMSCRERILAVYRGRVPDVVPYMLDLSHWFYQKNSQPWDLSTLCERPDYELIDYHKRVGAGLYIANLAGFSESQYGSDVESRVSKSDDGREITWELQTPIGTISRKRKWEEATYAWGISKWGVKTEQDLKVLGYALGGMTFSPRWDRYNAWADSAGDIGVIYGMVGYSAMGYLLNYWMGVEGVMYAAVDWPDTMHDVVDQINSALLKCVDVFAQSPAEVVFMGDNFSSDLQPPSFFEEWSKPYYVEAINRLHGAGKYVAVHIDGRLRGSLKMFSDINADCADAVTPTPMGDMTPEECRQEAGCDMILSGGVSPELWLPNVDVETFKQAAIRWIDLKKQSPRLIANAGDQVPPGAVEDRIEIMRDLVEEYGRY